ncbi:MAG: 8-amino-7-oxononanoate synthase [Rickettsiales bacterium]|nr:8-amino-7-oxononanoate synthase [Rickettsiales bacterium]
MQTFIHKFLSKQEDASLLRNRLILNDGVDFANNDYLCLSQNKEVINAFKKSADIYGLGSGGSVFISGYKRVHQEAEERFAEFIQREKVLLFPSGYQANLGVITSLVGRSSSLFIDRLSHASIIDAAIMSTSKFRRYPHDNIMNIKDSIKENAIICTEGVFSMEGSISDLKSVAKISRKNKAVLILDDAHALGVIGKKGSIDFHNLRNQDIDVLVNPLGKSVGIMGAFVSGTKDYIDYIAQKARSYKYTTSLVPAVASAISKSIAVLEKESWRQEKLVSIIKFFILAAKERGIQLVSEDITPIKSILVPEIEKLLQIQEALLQNKIFVSAIRSPTVPVGSSRIRISLNINHTTKEIESLLDRTRKELV